MQELDEDVEGMQSTILFLQQELKTSKDAIIGLERENMALKNGNAEGSNCSNNNVTSINNVQNGNATPMITNCSVVLYSGNSDKIIANSERILRKDKLASSNNVSAEPRTLRSSTRNVSSDDLRTTMVSKTKQMQSQCNGNATTDDIMMVTNGGGGGADTDDLESTKIYTNCTNDKRNYDSDSSCDDECGDGGGEGNAHENTKQLRTKKVRRSSVLSLDLNEEDSQIEIDDERTLNGSGTKSRIVD